MQRRSSPDRSDIQRAAQASTCQQQSLTSLSAVNPIRSKQSTGQSFAVRSTSRITWRYHVLRRARERGITREQAIRVLTEGDIIAVYPDASPYPMCLMMGMVTGEQPLYVALGYDETADRIYIVTVHWLDPDKWEDPWTRRRQL